MNTKADLWDLHKRNFPIVIYVNGTIQKNKLIMVEHHAGICSMLYDYVSEELANTINQHGLKVFWLDKLNIYVFPYKYSVCEEISSRLLREGCEQLKQWAKKNKQHIYVPTLPQPSMKILNECLNDQFTFVEEMSKVDKLYNFTHELLYVLAGISMCSVHISNNEVSNWTDRLKQIMQDR